MDTEVERRRPGTPRKRTALVPIAAGVVVAIGVFAIVAPFYCLHASGSGVIHCSGLVAFRYDGNASLFDPQAVGTSIAAGVLTTALVWLFLRGDAAPKPIRAVGSLMFFLLVLMANVGASGWTGVGAPFILPVVWLAARSSTGAWWWGCTALGVVTGGMAAPWILWALQVPASDFRAALLQAAAGAFLTLVFFLWTARPRDRRGPRTVGAT